MRRVPQGATSSRSVHARFTLGSRSRFTASRSVHVSQSSSFFAPPRPAASAFSFWVEGNASISAVASGAC